MVCNIMSFLIDIVWYSFIGCRIGDADGTGKLIYIVRQLRARLRERRHRRGRLRAAALATATIHIRDPQE